VRHHARRHLPYEPGDRRRGETPRGKGRRCGEDQGVQGQGRTCLHSSAGKRARICLLMRRAMALAILIACSSSDGRTEPNTMTPKTGTRVSELSPQRGAPRLVLTKDRAAWLAGDHLVLTALATKQKTSVPLADAHAVGVLGDDIAVATNALGKRAIVRFAPGDTKGKVIEGVMAVPNTGFGSIFAGAKPNELYIGGPRIGINRCRIDDRVVPIQTVDWSADEDATFTS